MCKREFTNASFSLVKPTRKALVLLGNKGVIWLMQRTLYSSVLVCHNSCESCTGPSSKDCVKCRKGFEDSDEGCRDVDECAGNPCKGEHQLCVNYAGHYACDCEAGYKKYKDGCILIESKIK